MMPKAALRAESGAWASSPTVVIPSDRMRTASGGTYTPIDPIRIGGHVGYNFDAEDFALGAQATMPLTRMFEIYPSFDYYFQDIGTLWALNVDLKIRPPTARGALYVGGGLNYLHFSDAGVSNGDTNLNLLGGFELRRRNRPGDRLRRVVHLQAVDAVPDELRGPAAVGCDNRFARTPCLEQNDSERFVTTRYADDVAGLIEIG